MSDPIDDSAARDSSGRFPQAEAETGPASGLGPAGSGVAASRPAMWRFAMSLLAATVLGLVASMLDAFWSAAGGELQVFSVFVAVAGLLAPLFVLLGAVVGVLGLVLYPSEPPSLAMLVAALERRPPSARARTAWAMALLGPAGFLWLLGSAKLSTGYLGAELPAASAGAAMALGVVGSGVCLLLGVLGLGSLLAARFPRVAPLGLLCAGLLSFAALCGVGLGLGTTSGSGGVLAVFGVFKRPELDLRGVLLVVLAVLAAFGAPARGWKLKASVGLGLGLLPLLLLPFGTQSWQTPGLALAVERGSALSKRLLPGYRKLGDGDRDGFSGSFGGGDCDDKNARVNPSMDDVPENGVDEDCSGNDAKRLKLATPKAETPKDAAAWLAEKLNKKFNVLLVTVDTLRADLGYMGYTRKVSPNIDKLAAKSTVFERAYALASYTSKSLPPMLIGKYPSETHRGWDHFNRFTTEDVFIQERAQKAGIFSVSVQGHWYFFNKGYGFERGFEVLDTSAAPKVLQAEGDRSSNSDKLSDAAIAQLKNPELAQKQFFMWVHYIDPHSEYAPHEGFDFGSDSRALYDGEVAFVDHHLGRVLDTLETSAFAERTLVVLTSDHGEAFKEHGMIRHGFELWEELVRVPLIVHFPGAKPARIKERRSIIDVVPTLLEVLRLPAATGEGNDFVSGQSLVADVLMPPGHKPEPRIVFIDMAAGPHNAERQAFIENDLKLVASSGRTLGLYNLHEDPGEKQDLSSDKGLVERVSERFKAFRRELRVVNVRPR